MHKIVFGQWLVLLMFIFAFAITDEIPLTLQLIPLIISGLVLGLPHGAVDHLVPGWVRGNPLSRRDMAVLLATYITLVVFVLLLWVIAPLWGFIGFILLTWWHWGLGDLYTVLDIGGDKLLPSRLSRGLTAILRGALPMLVPLIFFPDDFRLAATEIVALFSDMPISLDMPFAPTTRVGLLAGILLLTGILGCMTCWQAQKHNLWRDWLLYMTETLLLFVYFSLVPPFLAVGIYFCTWHSLRHIVRLLAVQKDNDSRISWRGFWQFTKQSVPMTVIALLMLGALYWVFPNAQENWLSLVSLYLALIAALTLPHTLVVMWMDYIQQIWHGGRKATILVE